MKTHIKSIDTFKRIRKPMPKPARVIEPGGYKRVKKITELFD